MERTVPRDYANLLRKIKERIRRAQAKAAHSVNRELIILYWEIGRLLVHRQEREGWGRGVIPSLARDLKSELPEVKGFSERNIKRMTQFYRKYPTQIPILPPVAAEIENDDDPGCSALSAELVNSKTQELPAIPIRPPLAAQLDTHKDMTTKERQQPNQISIELILQIPWFHHVILIEKIDKIHIRRWFMMQIIEHSWSRRYLETQIKNKVHLRIDRSITNFDTTLPPPQSTMAKQTLKDPYIFDFLTIDPEFREKELETGLINHLEKFLLELGAGFAYVGRQYHLDIDGDDFYIDLLFYHLKLRSFVVIDLKRGKFKPEFAGKMNFYLSAVDRLMRHPDDNGSIGLILCQEKKRIIIEYAIKDIQKPIGIAEYELTHKLPVELESSLPTIEALEAELTRERG